MLASARAAFHPLVLVGLNGSGWWWRSWISFLERVGERRAAAVRDIMMKMMCIDT